MPRKIEAFYALKVRFGVNAISILSLKSSNFSLFTDSTLLQSRYKYKLQFNEGNLALTPLLMTNFIL